jgi:hypothetical protein
LASVCTHLLSVPNRFCHSIKLNAGICIARPLLKYHFDLAYKISLEFGVSARHIAGWRFSGPILKKIEKIIDIDAK